MQFIKYSLPEIHTIVMSGLRFFSVVAIEIIDEARLT